MPLLKKSSTAVCCSLFLAVVVFSSSIPTLCQAWRGSGSYTLLSFCASVLRRVTKLPGISSRKGQSRSTAGAGDSRCGYRQYRHLRLVRGAVLPGCGSERGDLPSAALPGEIEEIPAAVIELAVYEEVKGRPDDGQVVVDADVRIVDAFFDVCGSRGRYAIGDALNGDLAEVAFLHQDENSAGQPRSLDGGRIAMRHAVEHGLYRSKDSHFVLSP
jgi:hypothetical protein